MEPEFRPAEIDTTRPHPARLYNYYLGGQDNFPADRAAAAAMLRAVPEAREIARQNRLFLQRVVRYLVAEAGIRQIIDIGTGIPTAGNVHQVAHGITADVRVAYVDNDPIVLAHASALLSDHGHTSFILADLRDPARILGHPVVRELIDFDEPVALLLIAVLHFITDEERPGELIASFRDSLTHGSYLALSHGTADFHPRDSLDQATAVYSKTTAPLVVRDHAQVSAMFDGWNLIEPGIVPVPLWRPDGPAPRSDDLVKIGIYGGAARLGVNQSQNRNLPATG
jgi:hypothetical protein